MKKLLLIIVPLIPLLFGCSNNDETVKIFISSNKEVDINQLKESFPNYKLEVSYASPDSYYYPFLFKSSREKDYDIFIIRDEEYIKSDIVNIYVPFDEGNITYLTGSDYDFYQVEEVKYGIKLNTGNYKINSHIGFEEGHDYYISLAKMSRKVGQYSIYKTSSDLAFKCLNDLL